PLYEGGPGGKAGRGVRGRSRARDDVTAASVAHLSIASSWEDQAGWEDRSGGASQIGPSRDQRGPGAWRSEGLFAGEHVPDRCGEPAGDVDLRDFGTSLFPEPPLHPQVAPTVDGMAAGVDRRFQQRPPSVEGAKLRESAATIALTGLVHARTEPRVSRQ